MMRDFLDETALYGTLRMASVVPDTLILVTEGEDDCFVLKYHCTRDLVLISGDGGKVNVLRVARLLKNDSNDSVRFLVDRDYDSFLDAPEPIPDNAFCSDSHDFFTDSIHADARILASFVDRRLDRKRRDPNFRGKLASADFIIQKAFNLAADLAAVRIVNQAQGLGLRLRNFPFGKLSEAEFDVASVANFAFKISSIPSNEESLRRIFELRSDFVRQPFLPVGDHDLISALCRILKCYDIRVGKDELRDHVVVSIRCESFEASSWFRQIVEWADLRGKRSFKCRSVSGEAINSCLV